MNPAGISCDAARERLSARLDGEPAEEHALRTHLARCDACREHEHALGTLERAFGALREADRPTADLWPAIERRARRRPVGAALVRVAAALVGFAGVGSTALLLERAGGAPAERHLFERLAPLAGPDTLFAALPEYRVLRAFPPTEESR